MEVMKKPILALLGLAGACAVCCSVPAALSVASVLSLAGLGTFAWGGPTMQVAAAGLAALTLAGAGIWWARRRAAVCKTDPALDACDSSAGSGCGCHPAGPAR